MTHDERRHLVRRLLVLAGLSFCLLVVLFAVPAKASEDWDRCMSGCLTAHHWRLCNDCGAYSSEQCPSNPTCSVGQPIYPACRSCITSSQAAMRACWRGCS